MKCAEEECDGEACFDRLRQQLTMSPKFCPLDRCIDKVFDGDLLAER